MELNRCPECGGETFIIMKKHPLGFNCYEVKCDSCEKETTRFFGNEQSAVAIWNEETE